MGIDTIIKALVGTGLTVERPSPDYDGSGGGCSALGVSAGGLSRTFVVVERLRAPYPNELVTLGQVRARAATVGVPLLVAPYVPAPVGDALVAAGWSWADAAGNMDLRAPGLRWHVRSTSQPPRRRSTGLPRGPAGRAIVRWLLVRLDWSEPIDQADLAERAGVSQPRVSQVLKRLVELEMLARHGRSVYLAAVEPLLDAFLTGSSVPAGPVFHGRTSDSLRSAAIGLAALGESAAVSADVGVEHIASYPDATRLMVYTSRAPEWGIVGATECHADSANIVWCVSQDPIVLSAAEVVPCVGTAIRRVDTVQLIADLRALGGSHRLAAADLLRSWFLAQRRR